PGPLFESPVFEDVPAEPDPEDTVRRVPSPGPAPDADADAQPPADAGEAPTSPGVLPSADPLPRPDLTAPPRTDLATDLPARLPSDPETHARTAPYADTRADVPSGPLDAVPGPVDSVPSAGPAAGPGSDAAPSSEGRGSETPRSRREVRESFLTHQQ